MWYGLGPDKMRDNNKTRKLGIEDVEQCMAKWQGELAEVRGTLTNIEKNV